MASPAPISESQLAANRANARHSTGPRTAEAKSRTRLNSLRHGLTGQTALLPEEDRAAYDTHHARFLAELKPQGIIETQIAHHIADDFWRLNRISAIENNIFALGHEAHAGEFHEDPECDAAFAQAQTYLDESRQLNLLSLYEQRLNRKIHAQRKELAELQRQRNAAASLIAATATLIATPVDSKTTGCGQNGFAFSTAEFPAPEGAESRPSAATLPESAPKIPPLAQAA